MVLITIQESAPTLQWLQTGATCRFFPFRKKRINHRGAEGSEKLITKYLILNTLCFSAILVENVHVILTNKDLLEEGSKKVTTR